MLTLGSLLSKLLPSTMTMGNRQTPRNGNNCHVTNFYKTSHGLDSPAGYTLIDMSRLASLSTPTRRVSPSPSPSPSLPGSPAGNLVAETTHHRMLKLLIAELKSLFRTWDELVIMDALKAAQDIVNEETTME